MFQKVTTVALIGTALVLAACNTVRGAARDVNSVANCTENAINGHSASSAARQIAARYGHGRSTCLTEERPWFGSF